MLIGGIKNRPFRNELTPQNDVYKVSDWRYNWEMGLPRVNMRILTKFNSPKACLSCSFLIHT